MDLVSTRELRRFSIGSKVRSGKRITTKMNILTFLAHKIMICFLFHCNEHDKNIHKYERRIFMCISLRKCALRVQNSTDANGGEVCKAINLRKKQKFLRK